MRYGSFMKFEKEIKRKFQSECDIPENVQKRMDDTMEKITGMPISKNAAWTEQKRAAFLQQKSLRLAAACLALAFLAIGGTVGAYSIWSHFEDIRYGITEENKNTLKKEKVLDKKNLTVTQNDVTVECVETVAAGPYAHVLLKVTVPKNISLSEDIGFDDISALENKKFNVSYNAGLSMNEDYSEEMIDYKNGIFYYEFIFHTCEANYDGKDVEEKNPNRNWDGQMLNLQLKNLAQIDKSAVEKILVKGTWNLDIPMKASDEIKNYRPATALSCGATVEKIELSPISIKVVYNNPRKEMKVPSVILDEDGNETNGYSTEYKSPAVPTRYELKDGTIKELELSMGSEGYADENSNQFVMAFAVEKILDVKNITAIYFGKEKVELR